MTKRGLFATGLMASLLLMAAATVAAGSMPSGAILQATPYPPGPTLEITIVAPTALGPSSEAPTGAPLSIIVIIGLLAVVVLAIIVGGMALMGRRQS